MLPRAVLLRACGEGLVAVIFISNPPNATKINNWKKGMKKHVKCIIIADSTNMLHFNKYNQNSIA